MEAGHFTEVPAVDAEEGAVATTIRLLIGEESGAPNFAMRLLEVAPAGQTPLHSHAWEHEVYGLSGEGVVVGEASEKPFGPGVWVFVPPGEKHQFRNTGTEPLTMICVVPVG